MGNGQSCCCVISSRQRNKAREDSYKLDGIIGHQESSANLQHISERERQDEEENDPSQDPRASTIFLERSLSEVDTPRDRKRNNLQQANHTRPESSLYRRKQHSSCSTIYLDDSTVSQPNLKNTIKCVALAIYYHIKNRQSERILDIFDEKLYPLSKDSIPDNYDNQDPEHKQIYKFIRTLFSAAQLTAECAVVTLVYLERLLTYAEIDICPANWKRMVLGAILLASKVWDDQAVWNVDYCQILKDLTVEDMNEMERQFLELVQFNINVPSSVYAKYYFDLRALANANNLLFPTQPLSKDRALKLEAVSKGWEDKPIRDLSRGAHLRKSASTEHFKPRKAVAILS